MLRVKINKRLAATGGSADSTGGAFALDVEFHASPGITILFGASGSGKTTTLNSIAGITRPDRGRIEVGGHVLFDYDLRVNLPIRLRGVGYVFQSFALFPHLSVRENVEFGMTGLSRAARRERALEVLDSLHIGHTADRKPREISGGEAQRAALARALSSRPRILLLDEPLSAIDEATKRGIIRDLKNLNGGQGPHGVPALPILYVTHSREEAVSLGERVIVYDKGRVIAQGEPVEVFGSPRITRVARLAGVENIFDAEAVQKNPAGGTLTVKIIDRTGQCIIDIPPVVDLTVQRVKVAVPPGDILLAAQEPRRTSARNILRGRILSIEDRADRVEVRVKSGVVWTVSVTRQSVKELGLVKDQEVWLAIKTHSCYLLDRDP